MKNIRLQIAVSIMTLVSAVPSVALAQAEVEQWGRFEQTFKGPSEGNPFTDVQLKAAFWRTDTTDTLRIDGFYDGDGRYVLRFMPTAPGEWRYRTESNVPALAGRTGSLRCVVAMTNHGPVGVRGTHAFRYADGTPYWPVGTTAYAWIHMPADVQQQTLASLEAARFNKLRMCVFQELRPL